MFENFFYKLREKGIKVSLNEWFTLQEALEKGLIGDLKTFYYLSRSILVKHEELFDRFDEAFIEAFTGEHILSIEEMRELFEQYPVEHIEKILALKRGEYNYNLEELIEKFKNQLEMEDGDVHIGGNRHIGSGGTSPWGENGLADVGISFGEYHNTGTAIQVARMRKYRNYSPDRTMDTRQLQVAISRLKNLIPEGPEDELDLDATIRKSSENGGDIELIFRKRKKNRVRLLLLMDAGGSMDPYAHLVNLLFSAIKARIRDLKFFYFHNCIYEEIYEDIENRIAVKTEEIIRKYSEENYHLIIVGDAAMAPSELMNLGGAIEYWHYNRKPCKDYLEELRKRFPSSVWLNPENPKLWNRIWTTAIIASIFPMFHLSVEGVEEAVRYLIKTQAGAVK